MPIVLRREPMSATQSGGWRGAVRREPASRPGMVVADAWEADHGASADMLAKRQGRPSRLPHGRVLGPRVG